LKASYHHLFEVTPQLLEQYKPIEKGAERDSYHQYPDVDRKVFTKSEIKKAWGKSLSRIGSSLDFEDVLVKWRAQAGKDVDLRTSDDVGNYVCDFVYYTSLEYFWKRRLNTPVVFMHVPPLPEKDDIDKGVKVTLGLIRGLAESNHLY
jgi:pyroglutamyl-peptidase